MYTLTPSQRRLQETLWALEPQEERVLTTLRRLDGVAIKPALLPKGGPGLEGLRLGFLALIPSGFSPDGTLERTAVELDASTLTDALGEVSGRWPAPRWCGQHDRDEVVFGPSAGWEPGPSRPHLRHEVAIVGVANLSQIMEQVGQRVEAEQPQVEGEDGH